MDVHVDFQILEVFVIWDQGENTNFWGVEGEVFSGMLQV